MRRRFLALTLMFFVPACWQRRSINSDPSHIRESDEAIVNKALDIYGKGKVSRADLLKTYYINVVYLPTMTCVGFNLRPGTLGGDETMCFDEHGKQIVSYRNGD